MASFSDYKQVEIFHSDDKQVEMIQEFNTALKYLDDLLTIDNPYFEGMVNQIYPPELQLYKVIATKTEAPFFLHLSVSN